MERRSRHFRDMANRLRTENRELRENNHALTEEIAYLKRALEDSSLDDLTGLLRRKMFQDIVEQEILLLKRHPGKSLSILVIDINDLKKINDRYGHLAGDKVLVSFAAALKTSLRDCDIVARGSNGADEFLVFLPEQNEEGAQAAVAHLMDAFGKLSKTMLPAFYGACIGTATMSFDSEAGLRSFNELYERADLELYKKKREKPVI